MDAQEKLTALKKAYADIILNISKEAAARVMSSERRAARYQHELKVGKEEALRMLMRLKLMMDFKNSQAEAASMNQQRKIEELEAQLQEAEDIVKDLREELGEAQTELERLKKDNSQHLNEPSNACSRETETTIHSYQSNKFLHPNSQDNFPLASDVTMPNLSERNERCKCNSETFCTCSLYTRNRDLPSIILRGKKPGLYRNGFTQRIRACERNLLDKELCLSGETDKVNDENNGREQEVGENTSNEPASGAKNLSEHQKELLADTKLSNLQSFRQKRKRATRLRKSVKAETRTHLGCEESSGKETNLLETSGGKIMQKDKGLKEKLVPSGDETRFAESLGTPDCKVGVEKVDVPSNGLEPNSSYNSTTEGLHTQSVRERVIKYTFQRKRKREALSGSEVNATIETELKTGDKKNGDQNTGDKQNGDQNIGDKQNGPQNLEQSKTSLLKESSRESRRLAQVARQLISLSENKWWH